MALTHSTQELALGSLAPSFRLKGVWKGVERDFSLAEFSDHRALVVVFMCNHCPYVIAVQERINDLARSYGERGVAVVGINSNNAEKYPADSFPKMVERSTEQNYVFPYLWDETQSVARAYGAVCTPDPFVFAREDGRWVLRYHGRIDDNWKAPSEVTQRDLARALDLLLSGKEVSPEGQVPAMGCSIKWNS